MAQRQRGSRLAAPVNRVYVRRIDFERIAGSARPHLPELVKRWIPNGRRRGDEYVARNPLRDDKRPGSFSVNVRTGQWADFASGQTGGDAISLAAYLFALKQSEAARRIADMLGIEVFQ